MNRGRWGSGQAGVPPALGGISMPPSWPWKIGGWPAESQGWEKWGKQEKGRARLCSESPGRLSKQRPVEASQGES